MKRKLPGHIHGTVRQWRVRKRRELRHVLRAFDAFWAGSAYVPVDVQPMRDELRRWHDQLKGNWDPVSPRVFPRKKRV